MLFKIRNKSTVFFKILSFAIVFFFSFYLSFVFQLFFKHFTRTMTCITVHVKQPHICTLNNKYTFQFLAPVLPIFLQQKSSIYKQQQMLQKIPISAISF